LEINYKHEKKGKQSIGPLGIKKKHQKNGKTIEA
jgi:hypothetical protein